LDEVDQLVKKDESALYDLLRLNQYVDNPIGLVMISNYHDIFINVEPRIKSSLNIEELELKPYTIQEMKDILTERSKYAFRPGSLEEGVILLCANHAINKGGDVRIGLECLRKAARVCEEENSDRIKIEYVKRILKETGPVKLKIMQERLEGVEKNIIDLLSKEEIITSTDLHNKYIKNFGEISQFALTRHIKHLKDIGMIKVKESRTETRGRKWFISLVKRKVFK
jgi:Cdc6-like AAA superfamily ATPase